MSLQKIPNDVLITGVLTPQGGISLPINAVADAQVISGASIQATKLTHDHFEKYAQAGTVATAGPLPFFEARNGGTLVEFGAGSIAVAVGAATVTIDLKKNGSTVLTSVITLDNTNTIRIARLATIAAASYVVGDWFEIAVTATAGGGTLPTGLLVYGLFREVGAP